MKSSFTQTLKSSFWPFVSAGIVSVLCVAEQQNQQKQASVKLSMGPHLFSHQAKCLASQKQPVLSSYYLGPKA